MSTRILVTGANGLLGRRLVAAFLADGRELAPMSRDPARARLDTVASTRLAREHST